MLVGGDEVAAFALELGQKRNFAGAQLSSSGRVAIVEALRALTLPQGKQVLVQTYVCNAVVWAIEEAGLTPQFCDLGDEWIASAETMKSAITEATVAIILAPPFGFVQPVSEFRQFGLPIVHDLCQASPLAIEALDERDLGDMIVLSFDPTKYMCAGGGGALVDRRTSAKEVERTPGSLPPINEMQAALGRVQLRKLMVFRSRRSELARLFGATGWTGGMLASLGDNELGDLFRFPARLGVGFEDMAKAFSDRGILVRRGVDSLAHRSYGLADSQFPMAVRAFQETVSIPFYPALTDSEAETIAKALESLK